MGHSGILKKLDDLCKLPKTTDKSLVEIFNKEYSKNQYYQVNKRSDLCFTINHYAGKVQYTAANFLEKNRDSLPFRVSELLKNSYNEVLSEIFSNTQPGSYKKNKKFLNILNKARSIAQILDIAGRESSAYISYNNSNYNVRKA